MNELIPNIADMAFDGAALLMPCEFIALDESNKIEDEYESDRLIASMNAWLKLKATNTLTLDVILEVHKILMQPTATIAKRDKGVWRTDDIVIAGRMGTPFDQVPSEMARWMTLFGDSHHLDSIQQAHVAYERIHPFADGNGRSGRMIMNWQRMKAGFPIAVIFAAKRHEYYTWFAD